MLVRIATSTCVVVVAPLVVATNGSNVTVDSWQLWADRWYIAPLVVATNGSNVIVDSSKMTGDTYCDAKSTPKKAENESECLSKKLVSECGKPNH